MSPVEKAFIERALSQRAIDVPQVLFSHINRYTVRAEVVATESGIAAGIENLERQAEELELRITLHASSGSKVQPGKVVATVTGNPVQIVRGEDLLLGAIAKFSGVATAAHTAIRQAGHIRVVCGGWKKMPLKIKDELRDALQAGGVDIRIVPEPFLYLDKNYVRIFGSLERAVENTAKIPGRTVVIQLRGETMPIAEEAITAARYGAQVLMVDTSRLDDLRDVSIALRRENLRQQVEIAFAGNIGLGELKHLQKEDLDAVDIGRAILDAPLLDFRYDVVEVKVNDDGITPPGEN